MDVSALSHPTWTSRLQETSSASRERASASYQTSNSDEQADAAIKLLELPELAKRRFFMWMHFVDPHAEYAAHPEHDLPSILTPGGYQKLCSFL